MQLIPIELESATVKLVPLCQSHEKALVKASNDGCIWKDWYTGAPNETTIHDYISTALHQHQQGFSLPFTVIHKPTNTVVGSTRLCNADLEHNRIEIGYTWYSQSVQRSAVNTECKLLLLQHAFGQNAIAVEIRTHWHNHKSRAAIARLGAKQDGVLRQHQKYGDVYRDTVVFSILNSEWPAVKQGLEYKLERHRQVTASCVDEIYA